MARALPIIGRAVEREAMSAAYSRALAGQSQLVLITGPTGIGKTRLVEDLTAQASADGVHVLTGESAPLVGAGLAFGPFVAALRDHVGWLIDDDSTGDMLTRPASAVHPRPGCARRAAPLLLVLEDLHWADDSSRQLLDFLAIRLRTEPVMLVATVRDDGLGDGGRRWLAELEHRPRVFRLRLAPLPTPISPGSSPGLPGRYQPGHEDRGYLGRRRQPAVRQGAGQRRAYGRIAGLDHRCRTGQGLRGGGTYPGGDRPGLGRGWRHVP